MNSEKLDENIIDKLFTSKTSSEIVNEMCKELNIADIQKIAIMVFLLNHNIFIKEMKRKK